jgi:hypothetical protein
MRTTLAGVAVGEAAGLAEVVGGGVLLQAAIAQFKPIPNRNSTAREKCDRHNLARNEITLLSINNNIVCC